MGDTLTLAFEAHHVQEISILLYEVDQCYHSTDESTPCFPIHLLAESVSIPEGAYSISVVLSSQILPSSSSAFYISFISTTHWLAKTPSFTIERACERRDVGCNNGGACVMGQCVCTDEFMGERCEQLRCEEDACVHGHCERGECVCDSGSFFGPHCDKEHICAKRNCGHGMQEDDSCMCTCDWGWSGEHCDQCSISCGAGGSVDDTCQQCICAPHRTGPQCEYEYRDVRVFFSLPLESISSTPSMQESFVHILKNEISSAMSVSATRIEVPHIYGTTTTTSGETSQAVARIRFLDGDYNSAEPGELGAIDAVLELQRRYVDVLPPFQSGIVFAHADRNRAPQALFGDGITTDGDDDVNDSQGQSLEKHSAMAGDDDGSLTSRLQSLHWMWIGLGTGLLLLLVLLCILRQRRRRFLQAKLRIDGLAEADMGSLALDLFAQNEYDDGDADAVVNLSSGTPYKMMRSPDTTASGSFAMVRPEYADKHHSVNSALHVVHQRSDSGQSLHGPRRGIPFTVDMESNRQ